MDFKGFKLHYIYEKISIRFSGLLISSKLENLIYLLL